MKRILSALLLSLILCSTGAAFALSTVASEQVATGGPYVGKSFRVNKFYGQFTLAALDVDKPYVLQIHNGYGGQSGFKWLRVFVGGDMDMKEIKHQEEPSADLVYDENYIERHTISIDLTGKVFEGVNTVIFEGEGPNKCVLSWSLEGQVSPQMAPLNPTAVQAGGRLTLSGKGFSLDPDENVVIISGHQAEVVSTSRTTLTVKVPEHVAPGTAKVIVLTNGVQSAPYSISVEP